MKFKKIIILGALIFIISSITTYYSNAAYFFYQSYKVTNELSKSLKILGDLDNIYFATEDQKYQITKSNKINFINKQTNTKMNSLDYSYIGPSGIQWKYLNQVELDRLFEIGYDVYSNTSNFFDNTNIKNKYFFKVFYADINGVILKVINSDTKFSKKVPFNDLYQSSININLLLDPEYKFIRPISHDKHGNLVLSTKNFIQDDLITIKLKLSIVGSGSYIRVYTRNLNNKKTNLIYAINGNMNQSDQNIFIDIAPKDISEIIFEIYSNSKSSVTLWDSRIEDIEIGYLNTQ